MKSTNLAHQPRLDHLRCLAASIVFLFHVFHFYYLKWQPASERPWLGLLAEGHTGVGLFFTLSGFLFMLIALQGGAIDYGRFVRNRFLRIFPLFTTVFVVAISVSRDEFRAPDVLYLFFSNLGQAPTSNTFITGAAWTISIEFSFYLVFPFLARFAIERGPRYLVQLLLLLLLFKCAAYGVVERSTHMFYSTLLGRFDQFLIGMLAAQLYVRYPGWLARHGRKLLWAAAAVVYTNSAAQGHYASYFLPQPKHAFWITWSMQEAAGWALLIVGYQAAAPRWPRWLDRLLLRGGEISFSFYLLHAVVIYTVYTWLGPLAPFGKPLFDGFLNAALLFPLCWMAASLSYDAIERPFLGLRQRYVTQPATPPPDRSMTSAAIEPDAPSQVGPVRASEDVDSGAGTARAELGLAGCLALGCAAGLALGLSFIPWGVVTGTGEFWQSAVSDRAAAVIGYLYFVADAWRWPVGAIASLNLPFGTNVIYTDSIPPVAVAMKALHFLGLPAWNYFGAWLLAGYVLNGAAMALVLWLAGIRAAPLTFVAALLAAAMPVLLHRWYHVALTGQFLILLGFACYVAAGRSGRPAGVLMANALLVVVSMGVHPYLGGMALALYVATLVRAARGGVPARLAAAHFAGTCIALAAMMVTLGYVSMEGPQVTSGGYGHFSANLLSLFASNLSGWSPQGWERLRLAEAEGSSWPFWNHAWPDATGGQYFEGFAYLGLGLLLLCALHVPYVIRSGRTLARRHWQLLGVLIAAAAFAFSNRIYLGNQLVAEIPIPRLLYGIAGVFRSSGRFLWLVEYAALVTATILTARRFGAAKGAAILAAALALQLVDTTPLRRAIALDARTSASAGLEFEKWKPWLAARFERVYIVPSHQCGDPDLGNPKLALQYYIARAAPIPTNSASVARGKKACADELKRLSDPAEGARVGWVFFADGVKLPDVARFTESEGTTCQAIGNVLACRQRDVGRTDHTATVQRNPSLGH